MELSEGSVTKVPYLVPKENAALSSCPLCKLEISPVLCHSHSSQEEIQAVPLSYLTLFREGLREGYAITLVSSSIQLVTQTLSSHSPGGPDMFGHVSRNPSS